MSTSGMGFTSNQKVVATNAPLMFVCVARAVIGLAHQVHNWIRLPSLLFPLMLWTVSSSTIKYDQ